MFVEVKKLLDTWQVFPLKINCRFNECHVSFGPGYHNLHISNTCQNHILELVCGMYIKAICSIWNELCESSQIKAYG